MSGVGSVRAAWLMGAAGLAMALAGCQDKTGNEQISSAPVTEPAPAAPAGEAGGPFQYAAIYDCGGQEIRVLFETRETQDARVWAGGEELLLSMKPDAETQTYTDGAHTLSITGGGAGFDDGGGPKSCNGVSREVAPPTLPGVVRTLTSADEGTTIELQNGQSFAIALSGVPTAGYVWGASSLPDFLAKGEETSGPTSTAQFQPGFAGGNHWEVLSFKATKAGEGEVVLAQRRPWEDKAEPDAQTFKVKVVAK